MNFFDQITPQKEKLSGSLPQLFEQLLAQKTKQGNQKICKPKKRVTLFQYFLKKDFQMAKNHLLNYHDRKL